MKRETQNLFESFQANLKDNQKSLKESCGAKKLKEEDFYGGGANEKVGGDYNEFIEELQNFRTTMNNYYDTCSTKLAQQIVEDTIMSFDSIVARYEQQKDIEIQGAMNESQNLTEADDLEFFKTEGLQKAKEICKDTNTNCKEVSYEVASLAREKGIDCQVVEPFVMVNGETASNNHFAILVGDKIIDYTVKQFLGDSQTVDYFELWSNGTVYAMSSTSFEGIKDSELENANLEELYKLSNTLGAVLEII